jgi:23S rRNA (pseudouridine1915-N3)-methyltransferase
MNVCVLCVGRLKEKWAREGCAEYLKRLSRYGNVEIREIPDCPEPAKPSEALNRQVMDKEGRELMRAIREGDHVVALCVQGPQPDSPGLAKRLADWDMAGRRVVLVIGGSLGLSRQVLDRADEKLSFSNLTFPHQLMRVVLLEQLYRAAKINAGERYHK